MHGARLVAATQADAVRLGAHVGHVNEALQVVWIMEFSARSRGCGHLCVDTTSSWVRTGERHACIVPPGCA